LAVKKAAQESGCPDFVFTCAGQALPGMFIQQDISEYKKGMDLNYFGSVNIIQVSSNITYSSLLLK
jgi:NADP-dependent 3-hydroxy acid dehydrogenase YdfG